MYTKTQPPFIFIKGAKDYFDENYHPLKREKVFKFLMIFSKGKPLQMMLMIPGQPFKLHAQGLLNYMDENGLTEITIHGGGRILFSQLGCRIEVFGRSYAFKPAWIQEVEAFLSSLELGLEARFHDLEFLSQDDHKEYHRLYTRQEVYAESLKTAGT